MSDRRITLVLGAAAGASWPLGSSRWQPFRSLTQTTGMTAPPGADTDFIRHTDNFGVFSNTSAADPGDNEFVATDFQSPFGTDILTSGQDPSDSFGFGAAGEGVPGETVNTLETPLFDTSFAIPVADPLAPIFTDLIPFGF